VQLLGVIAGEVDNLEGEPGCETSDEEYEDAGDDLGHLLRHTGARLAYAFDQDAVSGDEDDHEDELRGDEGDRGFDPATSPRDGDVRERAGECDRSEYCGDDD
jgi:hypothetical protein